MFKYFISWFLYVLGITIAAVAGVLAFWFIVNINFLGMIISTVFIPFGVALGRTAYKYLDI